MFDRVLNMPLDDSSTLDRSSKCVLLWKARVFIVLPIILNQTKTKTISHTVFEILITAILEFFELEMVEILARAFFIQDHYWNLKLFIVALKCSR